MSVNIKNEYGSVCVHDHVFATIAGMSAMETYGIVGMAAKNAADGLFELLKFESLTRGIRVQTTDNNLTIDIHVILQYGINISVVSENLMEKVRFNIQRMTGQTVDKLNLHVQGIRIAKE